MTLEEKLNAFKQKGWTYNKETDDIISHKGKIINAEQLTLMIGKTYKICVRRNHLISYLQFGTYSLNHHGSGPRKVKTEKVLKPKILRKKYIIDDELYYEIVISKGKGKLTLKAEIMLVELVNQLVKKFTYYNYDDKYDCISFAILGIFENWKSFDEKKYPTAFPYFTELAKRGLAKGLGVLTQKSKYEDYTPKIISLNNWY